MISRDEALRVMHSLVINFNGLDPDDVMEWWLYQITSKCKRFSAAMAASDTICDTRASSWAPAWGEWFTEYQRLAANQARAEMANRPALTGEFGLREMGAVEYLETDLLPRVQAGRLTRTGQRAEDELENWRRYAARSRAHATDQALSRGTPINVAGIVEWFARLDAGEFNAVV